MLLRFAIKNLVTKRRATLTSLAGIIISTALLVSIILILKSAQKSFAKPLEDAGADMIIQLRGEPCVWSVVKLPSNLNPIPLETVDKIGSLDEVESAEGSLITWAFSNQPPHIQSGQPQSHMRANEIIAGIESGELQGEPCDYGPPGSFCGPGESSSMGSDFSPIVVAGISTETQDIGPIKSSDLKNIEGSFFSKDDTYAAILDKDFARTRNLKLGDGIDLGQRYFKVIGIIDPGRDAKIAGAQAFIPLKTATQMTNRGDIVDIIFVKLKGNTDSEAVKQKIKPLVSENVTITTSNDYLSSIAGFSNLTHGLALAVFFIVILMTFLYIAKISFGSVLERSTEIGILKAIGWQDRKIKSLIGIENFILGLAGGIIGSIFGYAASHIYKLNLSSSLPYYLNPYPPCSQFLAKTSLQTMIPFSAGIFIYATLLSISIVTLSGFLASKKVLMLTPAEALRRI
jgi:ABC-type antimicrobial peptide transport system permease subunit